MINKKYIGLILIVVGSILILLNYKNVIWAYVKYQFSHPTDSVVAVNDDSVPVESKKNTSVKYLDKNFGLYIPKINANAKVIPNVDPYNFNEYNNALKEGIAHSKTSVLPGQDGNIFLFAHSAVNFYESGKYNVYFYLLNKLKQGDKVYISYKSKIFKYSVEEVKIVNRDQVQYLGNYKNYNTLTLMTCWPAGIDFKRVVVVAREIDN